MVQPTKPVLIYTSETASLYWPQLEPMLASSPAAEEFPPEAVWQALCNQQMFIFVFTKDTLDGPEVELALLLAPSPSETLPVMNLITVVGKNLRLNVRKYWEHFKGWCVMNGVRAIDAYVPERMEKFVEKELGLKRETVHVRLRL